MQDVVMLRREYGIGAREAYTVLPEWEVDLLLAAAQPPDEEPQEAPAADPWAEPPKI